MIRIETITNSLCTGCGSCESSCPLHAISIARSPSGFYLPTVDHEKCVNCGLCEKKCPILCSMPDCYAVWADDSVRDVSSSGGVFTVFAEQVLRNNGVVFGAAWTEDLYVKHKYIQSFDEIDQLRRSKYVQSEIGDSYQKTKEFLDASKQVLFAGTPCQVAGLYSFLGDSPKNLITLDFVCFNSPSVYSLRKYLHDNFGLNNIKSVDFRIKNFGWVSSVMKIVLKNDKVIYVNNQDSPYFKAYFNGYLAREACTNCRFSAFPHKADFTMGDFWKIERHDPSWNDGKGTSMLLVNNEKAAAFLSKTKDSFKRIQCVPFEWIREGQHNCTASHPNKIYFESLLGKKHFNEAIEMAHSNVYDIGMVCVQNYRNFGSAFTNYALYSILQKMNQSVYIITQPLDSQIQPSSFSNFERFKYPSFSIAPSKKSVREMEDFNKNCKQFLVGSDQLFNYEIYKSISGFIKLDWVYDNKPKSAYAASFGIGRILGSPKEIAGLKSSLSRFESFSVREKDSVDLVNKTFGINAQAVLDPVFLLEKEDYRKLVSNTCVNKTEIFSYILNPDRESESIIKDISQTLQMSVTSLTDMWMDREKIESMWTLPTEIGYSNEKWLASLIDASFVITDSFHALCFALIFNKPFLIIPNRLRGEFRAKSLLNLLGIKDRIYNESMNIKNADALLNSIKYDQISEKLEEEKMRSLQYLKSIVH